MTQKRIGLAVIAIAASALASPRLALAVDEIPDGMTRESVSSSILSTVGSVLAEQRAVGAEFLNPSYTPFVTLSKDSQLFTTFVDEGAGYRNSLGYFSFDESAFDGLSKADVDTDGSGVVSLEELSYINTVELDYIFPNASKYRAGGQLRTGDTVTIGGGQTFDAGTSVGFFLSQNTWTGSSIRTTQARGGDEPQILYSLDFLNPEAGASATTATDSTSNNSRHVALMFADSSKTQMILGFEDLNRVDRTANDFYYRSDEDFNDAVFIVKSNPVDAIIETNIFSAPAPMPGGLGSAGAFLGLASIVALGRRRLVKTV